MSVQLPQLNNYNVTEFCELGSISRLRIQHQRYARMGTRL